MGQCRLLLSDGTGLGPILPDIKSSPIIILHEPGNLGPAASAMRDESLTAGSGSALMSQQRQI